jgi:hypothetical protein
VRSRTGYWIAAGLIVAGVIGAIVWFVASLSAFSDEVDDFERVALPGEATIKLEARKYVVYSESATGEKAVPDFELVIADARTGDPAEIAPYEGSLTYSFSGRDGTARATVSPARGGDYRVRTETRRPTRGANVAVGRSLAWPILRGILLTFAIGGVLVVAGGTLLAATAIRRSRMRSAAT